MLKLVCGAASGVVLGIFWHFSPLLMPFPEPTGPYSVGVQSLQVPTQKATEQYLLDVLDQIIPEKLGVMIHLWYPAASQECGEKYFYLGSKMPAFQKAYARFYGLPSWLAKMLWSNIPTHARSNARLAEKHAKYPVVLFSHGLLGAPSDMYVSLIENLVSHGYIVVGIDHPYFNIFTQYPDGTTVSSIKLSEKFQKMPSTQQDLFLSKAIATYKSTIGFVLDALVVLNKDRTSLFFMGVSIWQGLA